MAHAPLPPSCAGRWIACPGSVQAEREAPKPPSSDFAEEGTRAHELFARCMLQGLRADEVTVDPIVLRPLALTLDLTRQILDGRSFVVETRLAPLVGLPDVWGTSDLIAFCKAGPVDTIVDLKFGEAIGVAADAIQLGIYALLAARRYGGAPDGVTIWVIQPRHDHPDGPARQHHYTLGDLDRLEINLRKAVAATAVPNPPRQSGAWCRFCAAAAVCPVLQRTSDAIPVATSAWFRPEPRWFTAKRP
jgi:hypothetical protein